MKSGDTVKIMTFNTQHCLNYVEQVIDIPLMAKVIQDCGADVVALNEMFGEGSAPNFTDQTGTLAQLTGMHHYFAQAIGFEFVISTGAVALAFTFSATVGILFGWAPARKASRLNPIDALRSM